jgi:hypothetical protein
MANLFATFVANEEVLLDIAGARDSEQSLMIIFVHFCPLLKAAEQR